MFGIECQGVRCLRPLASSQLDQDLEIEYPPLAGHGKLPGKTDGGAQTGLLDQVVCFVSTSRGPQKIVVEGFLPLVIWLLNTDSCKAITATLDIEQ